MGENFRIHDINMATDLDTDGFPATPGKEVGDELVTFTFPRSDALLRRVQAYLDGSAMAPSKKLLETRQRLFRVICIH